ncbi:MAG: 5'/3'-nucleotidase SurE, partial [Verrucomicrobia bacterium]|nr:5'/3'-nucleotidase SurE [Cytophagales bacterium]
MSKPLILVCNDDGITSRGIRALTETMMQLGEVVVVAPDSPQSGMGHAITVANALRLDRSTAFEAENILAFECSGTPADCVKLAKHHVLRGRKIDLLVSGINHGSNSSISVLYSGTMSAAIEGAMESIPSVGFSFCDHAADADFTPVLPYVKQIAAQILE